MAKSYSNFNYNDIKNLNIVLKRAKIFDTIENVTPSARLIADIEDNLELPFDTEKAKSELSLQFCLFTFYFCLNELPRLIKLRR